MDQRNDGYVDYGRMVKKRSLSVGSEVALRRAFLAIVMALLVVASTALPTGRTLYGEAVHLGLVGAEAMPRDLRSTYVAYVVWSAAAACISLVAVIWLVCEAVAWPKLSGWRARAVWFMSVGFALFALVICLAWPPPEPEFGPVVVLLPRLSGELLAWIVAVVLAIELVLGWLAIGMLAAATRRWQWQGKVAIAMLEVAWLVCLGASWFAAPYVCVLQPFLVGLPVWVYGGPSLLHLWLFSFTQLPWTLGLVALAEHHRRSSPVPRRVGAARILASIVAVLPAAVAAACFPFTY